MSNALRNMVAKTASRGILQALKYGQGVQVVYQYRNTTAVTLWALPLDERTINEVVAAMECAVGSRIFQIPAHQAGLRADISAKALTTNVATITTRAAHGFAASRQVRVRLNTADSTFDGRQVLDSVTTTTMSWAKTAGDVASTVVKGIVEAIIQPGDSITWDGDEYEVLQVGKDSIGAIYYLECSRKQPMRAGTV